MKHELYNVWKGIRARCNTPSAHAYERYGGSGIRVCARWDDFKNFVDDMGPRPTPLHTVDRIDGTGNYEPSNCRWATRIEQGKNYRSNVYAEVNGERLIIADWARKLGVSRYTLFARINKMGMTPEQAVTTPIKRKASARKIAEVPL